ncbi:MAG: distal tail protein Dit [Mediterraneibacter gnavus]
MKFNDIELGKYIEVLQGFTPFVGADWNPSFVKAEKQNGSDFAYTSYENKQIVMPFTIEGNLEEKYDALQKALKVDEPKKLVFGNVPNKCFYAIPSGTLEFSEETEFLGEGTITWLIPDGVAYSTAEFYL